MNKLKYALVLLAVVLSLSAFTGRVSAHTGGHSTHQVVCSGDTCDGQSTSGCTGNEVMLDRKGVYNSSGVKYAQLSIWFSNDCASYWTSLQNITGGNIYYDCVQIQQSGSDTDTPFGPCNHVYTLPSNLYQTTPMLGRAIPVSYWHGYGHTSDNGSNFYTTNTNTFND